MATRNIIVEKSIKFSLSVIKYCELLESKNKYIISRQLLRSGTSIGANIHEAQQAESKKDFIHKMKIAAKEADETKYLLLLCSNSESYPPCEDLELEAMEISKILNRIIGSSKQALKNESSIS